MAARSVSVNANQLAIAIVGVGVAAFVGASLAQVAFGGGKGEAAMGGNSNSEDTPAQPGMQTPTRKAKEAGPSLGPLKRVESKVMLSPLPSSPRILPSASAKNNPSPFAGGVEKTGLGVRVRKQSLIIDSTKSDQKNAETVTSDLIGQVRPRARGSGDGRERHCHRRATRRALFLF